MVPLFGEVEIELVNHLQGVMAKHIGIGHPNTLHGTPDMRVRGCDIIWTPTEDEKDTSESEDNDKCTSVTLDNTSTVPLEISTSSNKVRVSPYIIIL